MEARAYIKNVKITPKKLRMLLPAVKSLSPVAGLDYLIYTPKKAAKILYKAIKSAIDNAETVLKVNPEQLQYKLLTVEEGRKLKRYQPGGRGTVKPFVRRYSHIKVVLTVKANQAATNKVGITKNIGATNHSQVTSKNDKLKIKSGKGRKRTSSQVAK